GLVRADDAARAEAQQRRAAELARDGQKTQREKAEALAEANGKLAVEKARLADDESAARQEIARQYARVRAIMYTNQMANEAQLIDRNPAEALALLYDLEQCPIDLRDAAWNVAVQQCKRFHVSTVKFVQSPENSHRFHAPNGLRQAARNVRQDAE